ncbi:MAG: response regulator [Pyrinomonadaceae bacterium]
MDPVQTIAFTDEAELTLRVIRSSILVARLEGRPAGPDLIAEIRELRECSFDLGLAPLVALLETLERETGGSLGLGGPMPDAETHSLLDLISRAEAEVVKLKLSHDDTNVGDFIDASFDMLQAAPEIVAEPTPVRSVAAEKEFEIVSEPSPESSFGAAEDEFEADAEMLEIFAMEAEELLANIETNLETLVSTPADREALWEVRRHAHTFKGAAGIIGLKQPSELAHRIEDLLDHLAQNEIAPDTATLEVITAATACLRTATKGGEAGELTTRTAEVYQAFDALMSRLASGPAEGVEESNVPAVLAEPVSPEPSVSVVKATVDPPQQRRPIVRVSIARLDNLVRVVRDLVVGRSAVEQRLAEIETQLEALTRTTRQLQVANVKIENDFEASTLGSYAPAPFLRPRSSGRDRFVTDESTENSEFDALEFDRYTNFHQSSRELSEAVQECFAIGTSLEALKGSLDAALDEQRRLIEETQEKLRQIRLIKFESIATRLQRAVHVTCEEENKSVEIVIEDQDIELDTDVLDSLVEPLMHLIRNAVVHGIEPPETRRLLGKPEQGKITVRVANQETHVELKVSDDGRGISSSALRERAKQPGALSPGAILPDHDDLISLLALAGLTTAEKLTMSAGRGVGMGIVKESVESRGGTIAVETALQRGTTFTIRAPLAFAVTQAVLVRSGRDLAAIPFKTVKRIIGVLPENISSNGDGEQIEIGPNQFPAYRLAHHFSAYRQDGEESQTALLIGNDGTEFVLIVDEILKTEELAIKPLAKPLDKVPGVVGAAVLGNGQIAPVLDVSYFPKAETRQRSAATPPRPAPKPISVLLVDDSPSVRHMTSKVIVAAGWNVVTAKDGIEALEILNSPEVPDVILTDVEMPRMDGYELAKTIMADEVLRQLPLVFITSRSSEKHKERAAEIGVSEYLTKPFIESELIGTVKRLAAKPEEVFI